MAGANSRTLPKRLQIDFRSTRPTYELYTKKGCNRRDLLTAGLSEEDIHALLWNSYAKKEMRYTLILPEEWFWTDRGWWSEKGPHLDAMYDLAGGSFSDLTPPQQAELLDLDLIQMTGKKAKGNLWTGSDGSLLDIVRYTRERLFAEGYDMAPAYPEGFNLLVKNHCKAHYGKDITFIGDGKPDETEQRRLAKLAVRDVFDDPGAIWDQKPSYYFGIMNGLRKIKDFDKAAILETVRVVGKETLVAIYDHFWTHQTYENQMAGPGISALIGRRGDDLRFFAVTQKTNFGTGLARVVRDYAKPLGLSVSLIQLSPEK